MRKIFLLDCTLRDGGYINDWHFGEETIKGFCKKIVQTGIEMFEVGFMKGNQYNAEYSLFPDTKSFLSVIQPKNSDVMYVGMLDMSNPIPLERIENFDGTSIDGIRVIFKKNKLKEAYHYSKEIKKLGYKLFINFVGTDLYSDKEFIEAIEYFNTLHPFAMTIVDSFGLIKRKDFLRLVYLADHNMSEEIVLGYHAHNNLQQAFGNATALVELNLKRDLCIDACVFGMGRGAGNLNLELFAEYMNENYDTRYRIEPMLEIMDEYLNEIYQNRFWGYSLPLYLSASTGCHPNYAIYLAQKDSLTVKSFHELLRGIPDKEKVSFTKEKAEKYYKAYLENFIDDKNVITELSEKWKQKNIIILAPGKSIEKYAAQIKKEMSTANTIVIAVNFLGDGFPVNYIFSSNMRRYCKIQGKTNIKCIVTSNVKDEETSSYKINFSSYIAEQPEIIDNSGLMLLRFLIALEVKEVKIAGMDGYTTIQNDNYYDKNLEYDFSSEVESRNKLISYELEEICKKISVQFITPTNYKLNRI